MPDDFDERLDTAFETYKQQKVDEEDHTADRGKAEHSANTAEWRRVRETVVVPTLQAAAESIRNSGHKAELDAGTEHGAVTLALRPGNAEPRASEVKGSIRFSSAGMLAGEVRIEHSVQRAGTREGGVPSEPVPVSEIDAPRVRAEVLAVIEELFTPPQGDSQSRRW